MSRDARHGDYIELIVPTAAYQRVSKATLTRVRPKLPAGTRGVCDGYVNAAGDEDPGAIFVLVGDYYVVVDRGDYRILAPLEVLAECAK